MSLMIDGCMNCHKSKSEHMPDGACLFEPTRYKPFPPIFVSSGDYVTIRGSVQHIANVAQKKASRWEAVWKFLTTPL